MYDKVYGPIPEPVLFKKVESLPVGRSRKKKERSEDDMGITNITPPMIIPLEDAFEEDDAEMIIDEYIENVNTPR